MVTLHDGAPVPTAIDFGIAKATQQELTDKTSPRFEGVWTKSMASCSRVTVKGCSPARRTVKSKFGMGERGDGRARCLSVLKMQLYLA